MKLGPSALDGSYLRLTSDWSHPRVGDIIFVGSQRKSLVAVGQSFVRSDEQKFSHVALNLTGDLCIHSTPSQGVDLLSTRDVLISGISIQRYRVFRYSNFNHNDIKSIYDRIAGLIAPYFGKPYNYFIFVPPKYRYNFRRRSSDNAFCSELVSNFYRSLGISTSTRSSSSTLPADMLQYLEKHQDDWTDVTKIYKKYMETEEEIFEADLRQYIRKSQGRSIAMALKVSAEKKKRAVDNTYGKLKRQLPLFTMRVSDDNMVVEQYKHCRSLYFAYHDAARFSMSHEYRETFSRRRRRILLRFRKLRNTAKGGVVTL